MKLLFLYLVVTIACFGQVVFTPDKPANAQTPGNLIVGDATAGAPSLSCTITANAIPATSVSIVCADGGVTVTSTTVSFVIGMSYLVSVTHGTNSVLALMTASASGITVSATSHGNTPSPQGTW